MQRWSIPLVSLILFGALAFGQEPTAKTVKNDLFSSDLVMWSYMQNPLPEPGQTRQTPSPDPNPETQPQPNPAGPQQNPPAGQPKDKSSSDTSTDKSTAQSFTGTINKQAESFILQVSTTVFYKLDNEQQVQQYEGQRVRVTGTLDSSNNLIHVEKVEPVV
jgi:hypothetical protein